MLRAVLSFVLSLACGPALAQSYPTHAIKIVVPYGVGGPADVYARFLGARLQQSLGQPVVVEDRPGAGSIVGTDAVAKSEPDGYTLLMMSNTHTVNETLIPKKPFELMRDLAPITGVSYSDLMMVIHPSVPANNLKEFIALAKSKPGALNYASSGNGTPYHMAGELFKAMAGVDLVHIPHKGSDQARASILGGQVQMMFDAVPTMAANARAGKVKALATSGSKRSPVTPDVPTLAEAGVPGYESGIWLGLMAPAKTPRPVLEELNAEVNKILGSPDVKETWLKQGTLTMGMSIDQFDRFLREEIVKWAKVVKVSGAKADSSDKADIVELVQNWALWRDAGDWERFRTVWHEDGWMTATWFQGPAAKFIEVSKAGFDKGVSILHFLGGSSVDLQGSRAVAQTKMTIGQRGDVDKVTVDVVCTGRFYDFLEKRNGKWGIVRRQPIYEKDRMDPLDPAASLKLDPDLLGSFPQGYCHLAYLQTKLGFKVKQGLPQLKGPVVERLYRHGKAWLEGASSPFPDEDRPK